MPPAAIASFLSIHLQKTKRQPKEVLEKISTQSLQFYLLLFSFESAPSGCCPYHATETALLKVTTDCHISKPNSHFSGLILFERSGPFGTVNRFLKTPCKFQVYITIVQFLYRLHRVHHQQSSFHLWLHSCAPLPLSPSPHLLPLW